MDNQWSDIRGLFLISLIFIAVLAADVLVVYAYNNYVLRFIASQPRDISADAGIVFFGDYEDDGTRLGPDSELRADKAISLYKAGKIGRIICVGGYDISFWKGRPHLMKSYLVEHGIPPQVILHDSLSYNTLTNWEQACQIMGKFRYDTVIAISAPLHIFRISFIADSGCVYFTAYEYHLRGFGDYWQVFKDTHREFVSQFLNFALKDKVRNQMVRTYRAIRFRVDRIL